MALLVVLVGAMVFAVVTCFGDADVCCCCFFGCGGGAFDGDGAVGRIGDDDGVG